MGVLVRGFVRACADNPEFESSAPVKNAMLAKDYRCIVTLICLPIAVINLKLTFSVPRYCDLLQSPLTLRS